jgi:uncharacterized membrane protein YsdA (DUF1294 family)/cold shock CspA family protein
MKKQGKVVRWDDQRGFGFIRCNSTSQDIFFHIRDCAGGFQPPVNSTVEFEEIHVGGKGPRAMAVRAIQAHPHMPAARHDRQRNPAKSRPPHVANRRPASQDGPAPSAMGVGSLTLIWLVLLVWGVLQHRIPPIALASAFAINTITFFAYWLDKHAARNGQWRTKEDTLHLFGLAGGWPAARLAQQVLRHKTVKPGFQAMYWLTVWAHLAALGAYVFWDRIKPLLNS